MRPPDGGSAIVLANHQRPDLLFLDIVMPGATGLEALEQLDYEAKVVFTTAHDQFAVTAFELGALDYLLKPFGRERLERVVRQAQVALDVSAAHYCPAQENRLNGEAPSQESSSATVRALSQSPASLELVQGADDYVTLWTTTKQYLVSVRLSDLEGRLKGANFLRIHRSHLVNLEYAASIEEYDAARLQVILKSGIRIVASRTGPKRLRDLAL